MKKFLDLATYHLEFDLQGVKNLITESAREAAHRMVQALIRAHSEELSVDGFIHKNSDINLSKKLLSSDETTLMVYLKLVDSIQAFVGEHSSEYLGKVTSLIKQEEATLFIGSFAYPIADAITKKLRREQPASLENLSLWQ